METPTDTRPHQTCPAPSMTKADTEQAKTPTELDQSAKAPTPTEHGYGHEV